MVETLEQALHEWMGGRHLIVALSGGKDSTAMALRLAELEPAPYQYVCTPTGNELPEMLRHWEHLEELLKTPIVRLQGSTLAGLIYQQRALPNWRMRWCTRMLKLEPFNAYVAAHLPATLFVGLRADELEREGNSLEGAEIDKRFPLREWGWGINQVRAYLEKRGVHIPARTDCAACFFQTLSEWHALWKNHPEEYAKAQAWEAFTGHTLRSAQRDSHPAALAELRKEFEAGFVPKGRPSMAGRATMCSVCAR